MSNQQIIIFEGHDCSGKSNIARALSDILKVPYFKNFKEIPMFSTEDWFFEETRHCGPNMCSFLEQTGYSVILDRFTPSEWVYSKVFNRKLDEEIIFDCDKRLATLGAKIIFCEKDNQSLLTNYEDELSSIVTIEKTFTIREKFREFAKLTSCDFIFIDTSDFDLQRELEQILKIF